MTGFASQIGACGVRRTGLGFVHERLHSYREEPKLSVSPDRGSYDRQLIYSILDQSFVCSIAFVVDGLPFVVPTNYVRVGDKLFLHGSTASRLMRTLGAVRHFV